MTGPAARLPGPPELLPGRPDAVIDLQTEEGAGAVGAEWRYSDATVREADFFAVGDDLGPTGAATKTLDLQPRAIGIDYDDAQWPRLRPEETDRRLGAGRFSFVWYRIDVTIPRRLGDFDPTGSTAVFEIVIDDYAEVWVDGKLPLSLGQSGGQVVAGFNAPNRVVLTNDARPDQTFHIAILGINGPLSVSPSNFIWIRSSTVDFYEADRARPSESVRIEIEDARPELDSIVPREPQLERIARGFEFTEGPVWSPDGALLFSSPNTNTIYRWSPEGVVTVFRSKSGYTGKDIGRYTQPGSNGLTYDPDGRLTICQHGNRRVIRVEPRGNITVVADTYDGKRLNSPNDLVFRSDGTLFFTDPPFGLPAMYDDPKKELSFSGVYRVRDGDIALIDDELRGPNGIAFSPDERFLYVGDWDIDHKAVMRYELDEKGAVVERSPFFDMTSSPGQTAIDGIKVDDGGNLYVCGPAGIWILSPEGDHLGTLKLPEEPHNLAWGDFDGRTLFMTAMTSVYRMRLNVSGPRPYVSTA